MLSVGQSITNAEETRQLPSFNPESVLDIGTKLGLKPPISVINLIKVLRGLPSLEFTLPNSRSSVNPAYASPHHGLDTNNVYVLGANGSLWLEHSGSDDLWGQGQAPPREPVDSNVTTFQAIDANNVFVLGADGSLWFEHSVNGKFGQVPPKREPVDVNVTSFQAITQADVAERVYVLDNEGNLWLESPGANGEFGQIPPQRWQVDSNVGAFIALPGALYSVYVLDQGGDLWLEHATGTSPFLFFGQVPPPRELVDQNVRAFHPIDYDNVYGLGGDGNLWLEHSVNGMFGQVPPPREQVDTDVVVFQGFDTKRVAVLDTNSDLYFDFADPNTGKFGQIPQPNRVQWSGTWSGAVPDFRSTDFQVINPPASIEIQDLVNVPTYIVGPDGRFVFQSIPPRSSVPQNPNEPPTPPSFIIVDGNVQQPSTYGTVSPQYMILTLIYAPPGTSPTPASGGAGVATPGAAGTVAYTNQTSSGTTVSASHAFTGGITATATVGSPFASASISVNASKTIGDSNSLQIQSTAAAQLSLKGPAADGIDHDYDIFYIWLNPIISVNATPQNAATWALGFTGPEPNVIDVQVGELKNPPTIPRTHNMTTLQQAGLTQSDFDTILKSDPFAFDPVAGPGTTPAGNRYTKLKQAGNPVVYSFLTGETPGAMLTLTNAQTDTSTSTVTNNYGVTASATAGAGKLFQASLSFSFQWTNSASKATLTGQTQTATFTIAQPSVNWTGAHDIDIYWDGLYSSFMFAYGA